HELAHALEAKRRGVPVGGITLYLFGGATEILSEDVKGPGDQLALTIAGPWTSLVLGALFGLIAYLSQRAGLQALSDVFGELGWPAGRPGGRRRRCSPSRRGCRWPA